MWQSHSCILRASTRFVSSSLPAVLNLSVIPAVRISRPSSTWVPRGLAANSLEEQGRADFIKKRQERRDRQLKTQQQEEHRLPQEVIAQDAGNDRPERANRTLLKNTRIEPDGHEEATRVAVLELMEDQDWELYSTFGYRVSNGITKTFSFGGWTKTMEFVTCLGWHCMRSFHHPMLIVQYNAVQVKLNTHDCDAISGQDIKLARYCDTLAEQIHKRPKDRVKEQSKE